MNIKDMTLEQKIGQLFVVGFNGLNINEHAKTAIEKYNAGNIILFARNVKDGLQVKNLVTDLQELIIKNNGIAGFISIDQEGGSVNRIKEGCTGFPGNMAIGATNDTNITLKEGRAMGEELRSLGVNMNFAPVVDVNNNPDNPVIGVRSYGDNPEKVSLMAKGMFTGLQEENVVAVCKHFPGHGDTNIDSHLDLPSVNHDRDRLNNVELYPFKKCVESGIDGVMSTHILFPTLDNSGLPGTLSKKILTDLLRDEIGFEGLIVSDCMQMKAIADYYGTDKATVMAIEAGVNLVCVCHDLDVQIKAIEAVKEAVLSGRLSEALIDERVLKVLAYKNKYNINNVYGQLLSEEKINEHNKLATEISKKTITVVKDEKKLIPVKNNVGLIISPVATSLTIAEDEMESINFAKVLGEKINCKYINYDLNNIDIDSIIEKVEMDSLVVIGSYNLALNKEQQLLLDKISEKTKNIILVCLRNPYDASYSKEVGTVICSYEYTELSVESLCGVITGEFKATGVLPINL